MRERLKAVIALIVALVLCAGFLSFAALAAESSLDPIPDTGDHRLTWLWIVLAAVSAAGVVIAALVTRKKK